MEHYEIGQAWAGVSSDGAPPLLSIIGAIDTVEDAMGIPQRILSIGVMPHPEAKKAGWTTVLHMPITEEAFAASELRMTKEGVQLGESFAVGYANWLKAFNAKQAGAINVPVSKAYLELISMAARANSDDGSS